MFDYLDTALGAGVSLVAYGLGRYRARSKGPVKREEPKAVCACKHSFGEHNEQGCHAETSVLIERGAPKSIGTGYDGGVWQTVYEHEKYEMQRCQCKRYVGPTPIDEFVL